MALSAAGSASAMVDSNSPAYALRARAASLAAASGPERTSSVWASKRPSVTVPAVSHGACACAAGARKSSAAVRASAIRI